MITWTKEWAGSDNGTIINGTDLRNIQQDLSDVLQTSDIGATVMAHATYNWVSCASEMVFYEGDAVYC